jgi:hypothetical protein
MFFMKKNVQATMAPLHDVISWLNFGGELTTSQIVDHFILEYIQLMEAVPI